MWIYVRNFGFHAGYCVIVWMWHLWKMLFCIKLLQNRRWEKIFLGYWYFLYCHRNWYENNSSPLWLFAFWLERTSFQPVISAMWNLCYCLGSYKRELEGSEACLWAYTCSVEIHILTRKYVDPCTFQKLENYCVWILGWEGPFLAYEKNGCVFLHVTVVYAMFVSVTKNKLLVRIFSSDHLPLFDLKILNQIKP